MTERTTPNRRPAAALWASLALVVLIVGTFGAYGAQAEARTEWPPPVAKPDYYSLNEDTVLRVAAPGVLKNDQRNGHGIIMVRTLGPKNGTMDHNKYGYLYYKPYKDYNGTEVLKYRDCYAARPAVCGPETTIKVTVRPVNDAPVGNPDTHTMKEDTTLSVAAPGYLANDTDVDGDKISGVEVTADPAHGTATANPDGSFNYKPNKDYFGKDTFPVRITDGKVTASETITVNVENVNDAPIAQTERYYTGKNTTITRDRQGGLVYNDKDADKDLLKVLDYTQPAGGRLTVFDYGGFAFTPDRDFVGTTYFIYRVYDGNGGVDYVKDSFVVTPYEG